jgi:hypothetical protein
MVLASEGSKLGRFIPPQWMIASPSSLAADLERWKCAKGQSVGPRAVASPEVLLLLVNSLGADGGG